MVKPDTKTLSPAPNSRITASKFVVSLPLLVSAVFAFGFLLLQETSEQRSRVTQPESNQPVNASAANDLTLTAQPSLPQLITMPMAPDSLLADTPVDPSAVGPSSTAAGAALQSAGQHRDNDSNAALQATRKTIKLDELRL